jgi:hypothetical protein
MQKHHEEITPLPTTQKTALYSRQASSHERTMDKDLRELNTELLVKFAHEAGWTDDNLLIFNDTGIAASTPLEKREGMALLFTAIERDDKPQQNKGRSNHNGSY